MAVTRQTEYETIYILRTDVDTESANKAKSRVEDIIGTQGGHMLQFDDWGARKLAYEIRDSSDGVAHTRGVYHYCRYLAPGETVAEVERNLRLLDSVLKFLTVRLDEDLVPSERLVTNAEELARRAAMKEAQEAEVEVYDDDDDDDEEEED